MRKNRIDSAAPPTAAARNASPVSAPIPIAISATAIATPISTAKGWPSRTSGASGETRVNATIWAWIEAGLAGSRKRGSTSLSNPA